jgi:RNA polymerase sigma-70 factor (ECF subfamily)
VRFSTWLHQIAHNLCIDEFRKQTRAKAGAMAVPADNDVEHIGPEADRAAAEKQASVRQALSALPENQRHAILLCHQQGFTNKEAAVILGIGVRALESLLARARRTLKAGFNEEQI